MEELMRCKVIYEGGGGVPHEISVRVVPSIGEELRTSGGSRFVVKRVVHWLDGGETHPVVVEVVPLPRAESSSAAGAGERERCDEVADMVAGPVRERGWSSEAVQRAALTVLHLHPDLLPGVAEELAGDIVKELRDNHVLGLAPLKVEAKGDARWGDYVTATYQAERMKRALQSIATAAGRAGHEARECLRELGIDWKVDLNAVTTEPEPEPVEGVWHATTELRWCTRVTVGGPTEPVLQRRMVRRGRTAPSAVPVIEEEWHDVPTVSE